MKKEFVPYELALRMKQLGFDKPCFGYYDGNHNFEYMLNRYPEKFSYRKFPLGHSVGWTSAPTFSQAFRWFREKYDLPNHIHTMWQHDWSNYSYQWHITEDKEEWNCIEHYKTYEEAELACLEKLIEIVEQKEKEDESKIN